MEIRRSLKSEPVTEAEMRIPWTDADVRSLGEYRPCPNCGNEFTRWHRKAAIISANKKTKKLHDKEMVEYNAKLARREKCDRPPVVKQASLEMACCSYQVGFSVYGTLIPCGICTDGTCQVCLSSCSFVCKLTNYTSVKLARMAEEKPRAVPARVDNARAYLNSATSLKEDSIRTTTTAYEQLQAEGKLSRKDTAGVARAISHQSSLHVSNFISHNPPGSRARLELEGKMKTLNHPRGAGWITQNGRDLNLGCVGAEN
jgi:hypothetical protein